MNIVFAGGGTGGHLFPGIAIAEVFRERVPEHNILFVGIKKGIESRVLTREEGALETVAIRGFAGKGIVGKLASLLSIPVSLVQAGYYVKRFKTDIVVGLGGYISFPTVIAGALLRVPTVIHEQNSIPGLSNRILGLFAGRVFVSFAEAASYFKAHKVVVSGMPVRAGIAPCPPREQGGRFCVLVVGGSQGARQINRAVAESLPFLQPVRETIHFVHQAGGLDTAMLQAAYEKAGVSAEVLPFIDDMSVRYRDAHLVVSRAGSSTLAELAQCGKAAIVVPYPYAANNHQEKNARSCEKNGSVRMIHSRELTGKSLASHILDLEKDRGKLRIMERRALERSCPSAAQTVVDECCLLVSEIKTRRKHYGHV